MEVKDKVVTAEGLKGAYDNLNGKITQLNSDLGEKQNKNDSGLGTTSKTVVGAINEINERAFAERLVQSGKSGSIYIGNGDLWLIIARPIGSDINIPLGFLGYIYGSNNSIVTYPIHDGHGDGGAFSMSFSGLTANWTCGWGCKVVAYKLVNI